MPYIVIFFSWITAGVGLGLMLWDRHSQWGARSALVFVPVLVCASHGERVENRKEAYDSIFRGG